MLAAYYATKTKLKAAKGKPLSYGETSMFKVEYNPNGTFPVVGPHEYKRNWYATVTMENGLIKSVK